MVGFALALLASFLVGLMAASAVMWRLRLRQQVRPRGPVVDDAAVRAILERGVIVTDEDEPLDLDEIDEEERRFWTELWDEPDEW